MAFMIFLSDNTVARVFNIFLGLKVVASDRVMCHSDSRASIWAMA